MHHRNAMGAIALVAMLCLTATSAPAFDETKYPDLKGQWRRAEPGPPRFDPSKPPGLGQQAPLTAKYQAILEANLREQAAGVPGTWPGPSCLPPGMPATMTAYQPMEIIVTPDTTYIRIDYIRETRRRIFTDGRERPEDAEPGFDGYSIGRWIDEDGDGRYDLLEVETRHFKGPRAFELSGIPLHEDNETIVKERIFLDKADRDLLHDEITVIDNALTRPWTVMKSYRRSPDRQPAWDEYMCVWINDTMRIGGEIYLLDKEGYLMPAKKDQVPPTLKYFPAQR
jgi:hypothetical protein